MHAQRGQQKGSEYLPSVREAETWGMNTNTLQGAPILASGGSTIVGS